MASLITTQINLTGHPIITNFFLIQTHLQQSLDTANRQQIDTLLAGLYTQVTKLMQEKQESKCNNCKSVLEECTQIANGYRHSQEELMKVSQDRLKLMMQLKQSTDQSLELLDEVDKLKSMVQALQKLNSALTSRFETMEQQLTQVTQKNTVRADIQGLSEDYTSIIDANASLQKQMEKVSEMTSKFEGLCLPIRVIKVAFASNSNLRELVMRQAEQQLGSNQELRDIFIGCKFDLGQAMVA